jgi:hypothetical protein
MSHIPINKIEPHFLACFLSCEAACQVLDFLPDSDMIEELRNLIYIQNELFIHIVEGKHYGSNNITQFVEYTQEVKDQMRRLREKDNV